MRKFVSGKITLGQLIGDPNSTSDLDAFARWLSSEFSNVGKTVEQTAVSDDPTPFIFINNVFDDDFYNRLMGFLSALLSKSEGVKSRSGPGTENTICLATNN